MKTHRHRWLGALLAGGIVGGVQGQSAILDEPAGAESRMLTISELSRMSLEQLMDIEVTSAGKHPERLMKVPSSVSVVTGDEVARMGVTTLPDALRYTPGVQVAQIDGHSYAVTVRGFNDLFANKLLVMMDGRILYTPLFSGVFWQSQDAFLPDLESLEVVRGPGAALWGANAVNGVINILSKNAKDTQGLLLQGGGGTVDQGVAGVRYGFKAGDSGWMRVYGQYRDRGESISVDGTSGRDGWESSKGGFRYDWLPATGDKLTVQGDLQGARGGAILNMVDSLRPEGFVGSGPTDASGANILARFEHGLGEGSRVQVQAYFDHSELRYSVFRERRDTFDLDVHHVLELCDRHEVTYGLDYRVSSDKVGQSQTVGFLDPARVVQLFSGYVRDRWTLVPERLHVLVGTELEHNDFTGFEFQPSLRFNWTPQPVLQVWTAVSRAVRTPSRGEQDAVVTQASGIPGVVGQLRGAHTMRSESVVALETGAQVGIRDGLTFTVSAHYDFYDHLRSFEPQPLEPGLPMVAPVVAANRLEARNWGVEVGPAWQPLPWWRLKAGFTYLRMDLTSSEGSADHNSLLAGEDNPTFQFSLQSMMDLPHGISLDLGLRHVGALPHVTTPAYTEFDARIAWKPRPWIEFAVAGRNLADSGHLEFSTGGWLLQTSEAQRSVLATVTLRF